MTSTRTRGASATFCSFHCRTSVLTLTLALLSSAYCPPSVGGPARPPGLAFRNAGRGRGRVSDDASPTTTTTTTTLRGGHGVARDYRWTEEQFEIDLTVRVPPNTKSRQVRFVPSPTGVDLRLTTSDGTERVLLDGSRPMRGRLEVDGTFWRIEDVDDDDDDDGPREREVTVTVEKYRPPEDPGAHRAGDRNEVIGATTTGEEFDWGGVYPDDDDEVTERVYDVAEELDVREYARTLGVDLDDLNMSMVDKSMFSVANMTNRNFEELESRGLVKDPLRANEDFPMPPKPPSPRANDDERERDDGLTSSVYGDMVDADDLRVDEKGNVKLPHDDDGDDDDRSRTSSLKGATATSDEDAKDDGDDAASSATVDPIDMLTVKRLKDILRDQKLKVSGNKQELRDRLRAHVKTLTADGAGDVVV